MHAEIVEAMSLKSGVELREMFKNSLVNWKDDMVLLFAEEEWSPIALEALAK